MIRFNEQNEVLRSDAYRAIIAAVAADGSIEHSMDELEGLAEADGVEVIGRLIQYRQKPESATYLGRGKVEELASLCGSMEADTVIFNDELSGIQMRNLEETLGCRVIDRTILILDIFASRATSREGKLQVELAQLQYRLPRLTGFGRSLSRLGGGIGTRGPGEKKLETDRRHIAGRIDDIRAELKKCAATRSLQREERTRSQIPVVALMGYTNAGKSAIMNRILEMTSREEKSVGSEDMLFATLDPQHRKIVPEQGAEFVLIDTVGFVSKLPHALVEAFKSTLEEVRNAHLLLHVADTSYEDRDFQIEVAEKVMREICGSRTERIMVYNKIDLTDEVPLDVSGGDAVYVSAKTGENMDRLLARIDEKITGDMVRASFLIPYDKGRVVSALCEKGQVESMEYAEQGTRLTGRFRREDHGRYREYEVTDGTV
ncbi:MAG: GTPase HflX [Firmicutes bacterium]|nr:GTPase HflX [Bacillota bacterium]